jgi:hypothetical protein
MNKNEKSINCIGFPNKMKLKNMQNKTKRNLKDAKQNSKLARLSKTEQN